MALKHGSPWVALLAAGVARVVCAVRDPFPAAAGGAERLRAELAAVAADCGFSDQPHLHRECRALGGGPPREVLAGQLLL